jgi:hypothetical protein
MISSSPLAYICLNLQGEVMSLQRLRQVPFPAIDLTKLAWRVARTTEPPNGLTAAQRIQLDAVAAALQGANLELAHAEWQMFVSGAFRSAADFRLSLAMLYALNAGIVRPNPQIGRAISLLHAIGNDAQLATVELQDELRKQEQALHVLATTFRELDDTAMQVISKMRG